jgi:16S rRNA processing protein RimM
MSKNDLVIIGKIISTRGLKGELKVRNFSNFAKDRYKENHDILIGEQSFMITKSTIINDNFLFLFLAGIDTCEKGQQLVGTEIYYPIEKLEKLGEGEYYHHQLTGLKVYQNGKYLGAVVEVLEYPAHPNLRISGVYDFLLPLVGALIKKIDIPNNTIEIDEIEGLYEN